MHYHILVESLAPSLYVYACFLGKAAKLCSDAASVMLDGLALGEHQTRILHTTSPASFGVTNDLAALPRLFHVRTGLGGRLRPRHDEND